MPTLQDQLNWVTSTAKQAKDAGHPFPEMAACEAALEACFGKSQLAHLGNNLFGVKQHHPPIYDSVVIPTREFVDGEWVIDGNCAWVKYPSLKECFEDRMATLKRLQKKYPHYAAALKATNAVDFVTEVSKTWSTDPKRAEKVLVFYKRYFPLLYAADVAQPETQNA